MKKKLFIAVALVLVASASCFANVVPITTSCGKIAYIDTERGTLEEVLQQVMEIDDVLCP